MGDRFVNYEFRDTTMRLQRMLSSLSVLLVLMSSCQKGQEKMEITPVGSADPLPSWNDGQSKKATIDFVTKTTTEGSADFIPVTERIACFDNDGTLWSEQPLYFQFIFALDRIKELVPQHPEWKKQEPFSFILKGDMKSALAGGEKALMQIIAATQTGMSSEEFDEQAKNWIATAKHSKFNRPYTEMIFQPMLELLNYLRVMRATYEVVNDTPRIVRNAELDLMNDGKGKPVGIYNQIGKRPVFTAGNSDGDYEMLQWTTTATGYLRFGMIVHHTDSIREWAYDRSSHIGHLDRGLDDASKYNWLIVDMKDDWKKIYPGDK